MIADRDALELEVAVAIPDAPSAGQRAAIADIRSQRDRLLPPGFVTATGAARLPDLTRYLTAIVRRLERLAQAPSADTERMTRVHAVEDAYDELCQRLSPQRRDSDAVRAIGWQIEELRVSLWAQQLGTPRPVSEQRIYKAIDANHEIVPVLNKVDLPAADVPRVKQQIEDVIGLDASDALEISAKTGVGIKELLEAFLFDVAKLEATWTPASFIEQAIEGIQSVAQTFEKINGQWKLKVASWNVLPETK